MTCFTEKEKVELSRAMSPASTARTEKFAPASPKGTALQRWLRRAAVARELSQLDDRMLSDIGVQRWQIDEIADQAAGGARPSLLAALFAPLLHWHRRNEAFRQLSRLDDRMLSDIGISRADIPTLVQGWDGEMPETASAEAADADADADVSLMHGLRLWSRSRATAKALRSLDNHMLEDIGLVRGDIDWVAEELAVRSVWLAANRNHAHRAA